MKNTCLLTGAAGFIGFHLSIRILRDGYKVIGFDNVNSHFSEKLKKERLKEINKIRKEENLDWKFVKGDLLDKNLINKLIKTHKPNIVIHLAAQAGVRFSIENPSLYINSNIVGFNNIIESCTKNEIEHFLYASSSSVYGGNKKIPFAEKDSVDHPVSLYAASKRSNELIAHSYSHIHDLPCTGVRFFTVYGPWGRPDMAPMIFANCIVKKKPLRIFNKGKMFRDFTYIDDVVEIMNKLIRKPPVKRNKSSALELDPSISWAPHKILNVGSGQYIPLMKFINLLEEELNIEAIKSYKEMQLGDVERTFADTCNIESYIGIKPKISIELGVKKFISWFKEYYGYIY